MPKFVFEVSVNQKFTDHDIMEFKADVASAILKVHNQYLKHYPNAHRGLAVGSSVKRR